MPILLRLGPHGVDKASCLELTAPHLRDHLEVALGYEAADEKVYERCVDDGNQHVADVGPNMEFITRCKQRVVDALVRFRHASLTEAGCYESSVQMRNGIVFCIKDAQQFACLQLLGDLG